MEVVDPFEGSVLHRALALSGGEGEGGTTEREADSTACANRDKGVLGDVVSVDGRLELAARHELAERRSAWQLVRKSKPIPAAVSLTSILSDNGLKGAIPTDVGMLISLTVLDLSWNNDISGAIPAELGNLVNLETLDLGDQTGQHDPSQGLSGTIPKELGGLVNLRTLVLSWHLLDGVIPTELGNLSNLERLELRGNSLSGNIPADLGWIGEARSVDAEPQRPQRDHPQGVGPTLGTDVAVADCERVEREHSGRTRESSEYQELVAQLE